MEYFILNSRANEALNMRMHRSGVGTSHPGALEGSWNPVVWPCYMTGQTQVNCPQSVYLNCKACGCHRYSNGPWHRKGAPLLTQTINTNRLQPLDLLLHPAHCDIWIQEVQQNGAVENFSRKNKSHVSSPLSISDHTGL